MARSIRIEYAGAFYHVLAHGTRRELIFLDDDDRRSFLDILGQSCQMTGWQVHAWALLGDHYHLVIETPAANLVAGMQSLQNTYTRRFNNRHQLWGRLFGDRYKAVLVEGGSAFYYETLLDYVHLNPVRAGLVDPLAGQSVRDYPWSSVSTGYALPARGRANWLAAAAGLRAFGCADSARGRRQWLARLDRRARDEAGSNCGVTPAPADAQGRRDERRSHLRDGWYWGSPAFAQAALKKAQHVNAKKGPRSTRVRRKKEVQGEEDALALLDKGLKKARLTPPMLAALPGSDLRKVALAQTLREQTTMNLRWIAERLQMKSPANVGQQIRRKSADLAVRTGSAAR